MNSQIYQTNTFAKGMNMDVDISMLPSDQYRYAENIRLLTNDGGTTGVLQGVEGIEKLAIDFILPGETIIGSTTVKNYAVIFTKEYDETGCFNRVWRYDFTDNIKLPVVTLLLSGYYNIVDKLSIVTHYTNSSNIKLYFADGTNMIRVIDITKVTFVYNPATPLVTYDIGSLDIIPSATILPLKCVGLGYGSLPSGVIQYCYQLFNIYGNESSTSSLSELIPLSDSNLTDAISYGQAPNKNSNKSVLLTTAIESIGAFNKCRIISIHYTSNTSLPTISIVNEITIGTEDSVIYYEDKGNNYLSELTVEEFNGLTGLQFAPTSIDKLDNKLFASNIKDLTWDVEGYDTRAYRFNVNRDTILQSVSSGSVITFNDTDVTKPVIPETYDCINPFNSLKSSEFTSTNRYEYQGNGTIRGGSGVNISYELITTDLRIETTNLSGVDTQVDTSDGYKAADTAEFKTPSILGKTLPIHGGTGGTIELAPIDYNSKKNYSDPLIAERFKSYQRDEVYRFGIIFYNDKNIPTPVHWISDIRMPHLSEPTYSIFDSSYTIIAGVSKTYITNVHPLGLQFTVTNLPGSVKAYEIVRCQRTVNDRTVLMQGAISNLIKYVFNESTAGNDVDIRPYHYLSYGTYMADAIYTQTQDMVVKTFYYSMHAAPGVRSENNVGDKCTEYYNFISPEVCYNKENIKDTINGSMYLDTIYGLASPINKCRVLVGDTVSSQVEASMCTLPIIKNAAGDITGNINLPSTTDDVSVFFRDSGEFQQAGGNSDPCIQFGRVPRQALVSKYLYPFYQADIRNSVADTSNFKNISKVNANITAIKYATPLMWNNNTKEDILANGVSVNDKLYHNWSENFELNQPDNATKTGPHGYSLVFNSASLYSQLPGIYQVGPNIGYPNTIAKYRRKLSLNSILIANLKQNVTQYGGNTYSSICNSVYISIGAYTKIGTSTVTCFGGDTFLGVLDYNTTMLFSRADLAEKDHHKIYHGAYIPFESSINFAFKQDESFSDSYAGGYANEYLQNKAGQFLSASVQKLDPYTYNDAYSTQPGSKKYVSKMIYDLTNFHYSNRITCSQVKQSVDVVDQWTKFKFADYIDIDNQYGEITNLRTFNDKLYYWQEEAFGIASVNERSLIQDNNLGALTLGTGGILVRYDNISTNNGNSIKNDRSIVKSDTTIYWYDFNNNEIVAFGNDIHSLSKVKSAQSYFNELPNNKRNSVVSYYDKKYNEVVFKVYDKSLVFNEQLQAFTCFYTIDPVLVLPFSNRYYTIGFNNEMYLHNTTDNLVTSTYPTIKTSKIQFVINKDLEYTKTFDNVFFNGDFTAPVDAIDKDIVKDVWFKTKYQTNLPINQSNMDNREDTYRFAINREINNNTNNNLYNNSFLGRMKGKYLMCNYSFDCTEGKTFNLPSIRTTYRYSLV